MTKTTNLFLFLAIATILLASPLAVDHAFADKDDEKEDKNKDDKLTKLQKECSKEPKNPSKIKPDCELLNLINENQPNPQADSFFDVFFDVELYSVDSFFDIFTELQQSSTRADSFFDVFFDVELYSVDSFFDIFTELQTDVDRIDTEIVALSLQSCDVGDVVTGFVTGSDGTIQIQCAPDQQGGFDNIQGAIDAKSIEIADIENQIAIKDFELGELQIQLDALALPQIEILKCQQQCAALKAKQQRALSICAFEANQLGVEFEIHCSAEIAAADTPCTCPTTSDPVLAEQLTLQITTLNSELEELNKQLENGLFELSILETLQNQFGLPPNPTPGI